MQLLRKYDSVINFELEKSRQEVIDIICRRFKECHISRDELVVEEKPTFLDPFAGRGRLTFQFSTIDDKNTQVRVEVKPTSITREDVYYLITFFALLFLLSFPFVPLAVSLGFLLGSSTIMVVLLHFAQKLNSGKLENLVFGLKQRETSQHTKLA